MLIKVKKSGYSPSAEFLADDTHQLRAYVEGTNNDIYLDFSSRRAMYEFALSLLHEAVYGESGGQEFLAVFDGVRLQVSDGVRLSSDSSRMFTFYDTEKDPEFAP
jgi:hypothetical protein